MAIYVTRYMYACVFLCTFLGGGLLYNTLHAREGKEGRKEMIAPVPCTCLLAVLGAGEARWGWR